MNGLELPMTGRANSLMMFTALALVTAGPVAAQVKTGLATQVVRPSAAALPKPAVPAKTRTTPGQPAPDAPVPGNPDYAPPAAQAAPPVPAPLPPPVWDVVSAQDLLYYIEQVGKEGLN